MLFRKKKSDTNNDAMGRLPGWYDAMEGRCDALAAALDQGLDVDHVDTQGMTLLFVASHYGHRDCVRLLLERGADPNLVNAHGNGPLWEATREASQNANPKRPTYDVDVVRMLLDAGANPAHLNKAGRPPAAWASLSEDLRQMYRDAGYEGEFEP